MRAAITVLALALVAVGCDDPTGADSGKWKYSEGTDEVSGKPWANARLSGLMPLVVRCRQGSFQVFVTTWFITQSGRVRYRIDDGEEVVQIWREATDFKALFYRGDAVAFAETLARSSEMVFAAREYLGGEHVTTHDLPGLEVYLPKLREMCGV